MGALGVTTKSDPELYNPWPLFSKALIWLMETWPEKKTNPNHTQFAHLWGFFSSYFFLTADI